MDDLSRIKQLANVSETEKEPIDFTRSFFEAGRSSEAGITENDVDQEQLKMGIEVEYEHTTDATVAKKIALDHLAEIPDYYTRLAKMEEEGKRAHKQNNPK